jgi:hypothetical protein
VKLLVSFQTIGAALDFEKAMKSKQLPVEIIPTPRCLGVSCSYSAIIEHQHNSDINNVPQDGSKLYQIIVNDTGHEIYEPYNQLVSELRG